MRACRLISRINLQPRVGSPKRNASGNYSNLLFPAARPGPAGNKGRNKQRREVEDRKTTCVPMANKFTEHRMLQRRREPSRCRSRSSTSGTGSRNKSRSREEAAPCNQATTRLQSEELHVRGYVVRVSGRGPPKLQLLSR